MQVQGSRKIALNPGGSEGNLATCQLPIPRNLDPSNGEYYAHIRKCMALVEMVTYLGLTSWYPSQHCEYQIQDNPIISTLTKFVTKWHKNTTWATVLPSCGPKMDSWNDIQRKCRTLYGFQESRSCPSITRGKSICKRGC